jgi:transposase
VLQDVGAQVHLAHPPGVKGFAYRRVKNDQRDAADLADLLRVSRFLMMAWRWSTPCTARLPTLRFRCDHTA